MHSTKLQDSNKVPRFRLFKAKNLALPFSRPLRPELRFVNDGDAQLLGLGQLRASIAASQDEVGLLANAAAYFPPQSLDLGRRFFPGHRGQRASQNERFATQRTLGSRRRVDRGLKV